MNVPGLNVSGLLVRGRARLTVGIGYIEQVRLAGIGTYLLPYYPRRVNHRQSCLLIPYMQSQNVPSLMRTTLTHSVRISYVLSIFPGP